MSAARWLLYACGAVVIIGTAALVIRGDTAPERPPPEQIDRYSYIFDPPLTPTPAPMRSIKPVIERRFASEVGGEYECNSYRRHHIEIVDCHTFFDDVGQGIIVVGQYDLTDYSTQRHVGLNFLATDSLGRFGTATICFGTAEMNRECETENNFPAADFFASALAIKATWMAQLE